jgi:hypothetical protein
MRLKEIRKQYPQYDILSDGELATALHQKMYPTLDFKDFSKKVGYLKGAYPAEYDPESEDFKNKYGPASGMSGLGRAWTGFGKNTVDLGRGAGQLLGIVSRDDVKESRKLDADLMRYGSAKAGNIAGSVMTAVPAAMIPGVNGYAGAAVAGGALGSLALDVLSNPPLTHSLKKGSRRLQNRRFAHLPETPMMPRKRLPRSDPVQEMFFLESAQLLQNLLAMPG